MPIVGINPSRRITGKFADLPSGEEVGSCDQVVSSSVVSSVNSPSACQDETGTIQLYLDKKRIQSGIAIQMLSTTSNN